MSGSRVKETAILTSAIKIIAVLSLTMHLALPKGNVLYSCLESEQLAQLLKAPSLFMYCSSLAIVPIHILNGLLSGEKDAPGSANKSGQRETKDTPPSSSDCMFVSSQRTPLLLKAAGFSLGDSGEALVPSGEHISFACIRPPGTRLRRAVGLFIIIFFPLLPRSALPVRCFQGGECSARLDLSGRFFIFGEKCV